MLFEINYQFRIQKKAAWIRGKRNNQAAIPTELAEVVDVLFVKKGESYQMAYKCVYEDGRVGYIFNDETEHCEFFTLETKIDKSTLT